MGGNTPFHFAVIHENPRALYALAKLLTPPSVSKFMECMKIPNKMGLTPLDYAVLIPPKYSHNSVLEDIITVMGRIQMGPQQSPNSPMKVPKLSHLPTSNKEDEFETKIIKLREVKRTQRLSIQPEIHARLFGAQKKKTETLQAFDFDGEESFKREKIKRKFTLMQDESEHGDFEGVQMDQLKKGLENIP